MRCLISAKLIECLIRVPSISNITPTGDGGSHVCSILLDSSSSVGISGVEDASPLPFRPTVFPTEILLEGGVDVKHSAAGKYAAMMATGRSIFIFNLSMTRKCCFSQTKKEERDSRREE